MWSVRLQGGKKMCLLCLVSMAQLFRLLVQSLIYYAYRGDGLLGCPDCITAYACYSPSVGPPWVDPLQLKWLGGNIFLRFRGDTHFSCTLPGVRRTGQLSLPLAAQTFLQPIAQVGCIGRPALPLNHHTSPGRLAVEVLCSRCLASSTGTCELWFSLPFRLSVDSPILLHKAGMEFVYLYPCEASHELRQ